MLSITNNLMADNATQRLGGIYSALGNSVRRSSSGLRVSSAKDGAAGLAVRELIRADAAEILQGARNGLDAVSMLQTADGSLATINMILVRMEGLAEQAASESYSTTQRSLMNDEFQSLKDQIAQVVAASEFNGNNLLNEAGAFDIAIGSDETIQLTGYDLTAGGDALGLGGRESFVGPAATSTSDTYIVASGDANEAITFTSDDGAKPSIKITITIDGDTSLEQLRDTINAVGQSIAGYDPATIGYDGDTGFYFLRAYAEYDASLDDTTGVTVSAIDGADPTWGPATVGMDGAAIEAAHFANVDGSGGVDLLTPESAQLAAISIEDAIGRMSAVRAELGDQMNRLEDVVEAASVRAENLQVAASRISDVDVAVEAAAMMQNQVQAQAGIAMLAQANSIPEMALQLLS